LELHAGDPRCRVGSLQTVHRISKALRRTKDMIWSTFISRYIVLLMAI